MKTLILTLLLSSVFSFGQNQNCLKYEPTIVKLNGVIERQTFPGRPNYQSIKTGDEPEICWILKLSKPVCTIASDSNIVNEAESNVTRIQLLLHREQYTKYKNFVGHKVDVTGTLFHSISGHHHTKVLLTTTEIKLR